MHRRLILLVLIISGCSTTEYHPYTSADYLREEKKMEMSQTKIPTVTEIPNKEPPNYIQKEVLLPQGGETKKKSKRLDDKLKRIHKLTE